MLSKKFAYRLLIIVIVLVVAFLSVAASPIYTYKIVLPDTNLYLNSDITSEVIAIMPQNATVELVGECFLQGEYNWQKVSYNTIEGYVITTDLYESKNIDSYTIKHGKARSITMGEDINLYLSNDLNSGIVNVIHDGEEINIVVTGIDYNGFELIEYDEKQYFALSDNVTTTLSLNEMLALIIGCSAAGLIVIILVIAITVKNKKIYR